MYRVIGFIVTFFGVWCTSAVYTVSLTFSCPLLSLLPHAQCWGYVWETPPSLSWWWDGTQGLAHSGQVPNQLVTTTVPAYHCVYTYTYMYTHMYVYICTHMGVHILKYMHTWSRSHR